MGSLITDPHQYHCDTDWYYTKAGKQGRLVRHECHMHELDCDSYVHALWRAGNGRNVRTLVRCDTHIDRLTGCCLLCMGIVDAELVHSDGVRAEARCTQIINCVHFTVLL